MPKTVFDVLIDRIDEHKTSATEFLSDGGAKDFASYKETCGIIRGLNAARREIEDLSRNYMDESDD